MPIKSWYVDKSDRELYLQTPILEFLSNVYDVRDYLKRFINNNEISYQLAWNMINSVKSEMTQITNSSSNNEKPLPTNNLSQKQINISQNDEKMKPVISNPQNLKTNLISNNTFKKPLTANPSYNTNGYNSGLKNDNSHININIINNNINHYIINNPNDDSLNKEKKKTDEKRIKSFRTSYTANNPSLDYNSNLNSISPTSPYNLDKKINTQRKDIGLYQQQPSQNNNNLGNKLFINNISTSRQNNNSNSNLLSTGSKNNLNIVTNNSKINQNILSNNTITTSTNKNSQHRPSSAIALNVRHQREKSNNQSQTSSTIKDILNRKGSNNSLLVNPISTGINLGNLHRSESTSSYSTKNRLTKSTFTNKLSIENKMNNDIGDLTKNPRGNQSTRPSSEKLFKSQLYNDINRRSNSQASKSIERKGLSGSIKNLKLEDQKFYDSETMQLNKHSNSNSNLLAKNFSITTNRSGSINSGNVQNYIKNRDGQNTVKNSNLIVNPNNSKNFGLLIQTDYKNKVRSPSNSTGNLLVSQIMKERANLDAKNSGQYIKNESIKNPQGNLRLNIYN